MPDPSRPGTRTSPSATSVDRKSTRLNSSHSQISYAVFCLKKKKHIEHHPSRENTKASVVRPLYLSQSVPSRYPPLTHRLHCQRLLQGVALTLLTTAAPASV